MREQHKMGITETFKNEDKILLGRLYQKESLL